jgi:DNA polymerase-1
VLEELAAQGHVLPRLLLEWRQVDKLKGTYVDALPLLINPRTRRIHTSFNQTVAATGRLSSSDPNLQNIPIRTAQGAEIRRGFIPAAGYAFLGADYSQIELRILAHFSEDDAFVQAFRTGQDIHRQTAAVIWNVPAGDVTPRMRAVCQDRQLRYHLRSGPFALAQQLGIPQAETRVHRPVLRALPGVPCLDSQIETARSSGSWRPSAAGAAYIPEINSRNYSIRQFGERAACCARAGVRPTSSNSPVGIHHRLAAEGSAHCCCRSDERSLRGATAGDATRTLVQDVMEHAFPVERALEVRSGPGIVVRVQVAASVSHRGTEYHRGTEN